MVGSASARSVAEAAVARMEPAAQVLTIAATSGEEARAALEAAAERLARLGARVAGVLEYPVLTETGPCGHYGLRDVSTGAEFSISQDLGRLSKACNLETAGLAGACAAVERAIAQGADVVILSKFGKQEAARGGLSDAFRAAILAGIPVITTVSPAAAEGWAAFAGSLADAVPPDAAAIEAWWKALHQA